MAADRPLRILFELPEAGYLRMYESTLRLLAARGHRVLLTYDTPAKRAAEVEEALAHVDGIELVEPLPWEPSQVRRVAETIRPTADLLRYAHPRLAHARHLRGRMVRYVPERLRWTRRLPRPAALAALRALLAADALLPPDPHVLAHLERLRPDAIVVSPLVARGVSGIRQTETVKAGRRLGIPVGLAVASWDHLSSKGIVKRRPDRVFVWNDVQRREAVELHRIPAEHVVATGAQLFDTWFDRTLDRTAGAFRASVGLAADAPHVLYVGSSPNITEPAAEEAFVRRWVAALRAAPPPLRDVQVLVRPHPGNAEHWSSVEPDDPRVAIAPRTRPSIPMSDGDARLYFESIGHAAAVVGINTSAIIESLVQRVPVLTIRAAEFGETQEGSVHFHYLRPGILVADALDEHVEQLARVLEQPQLTRDRIEDFLVAFVRPHGLDRPATPILADAVEELAGRRSAAAPVVASASLGARERGVPSAS